jgi:hypothetical protein
MSENINTGKSWSDKTRVSLKTVPQTDLEIIQYFEDSIGRTKNLIEEIFKKDRC